MTQAWSEVLSALAGSRGRALRAMGSAARVQDEQLSGILRRNLASAFGRRHRFSGIRTAGEYAQAVPVQTYESLEPFINAGGLTTDPPVAYERTGGSTAGPKLIPYTRPGLDAFARAIRAWLEDLLLSRPGIAAGRCYWPISPATRAPEKTRSGIPIGFDNDAAYFGESLGGLLSRVLISPPCGLVAIGEWRAATLGVLRGAPDLSMVSVWSPTFWLELLRHLPEDPRRLWPRLDTISCWTSGASAPFARELAARFPGVFVQGKGLLATEGVVTIPLAGYPHPVLAVESGFFEFLDAAGRAHTAVQLEAGGEYEVLLTTHSGLYRYRLGDRVALRGWAGEAPLLEFLGRGGAVSDLCGEKLAECFVQPHLDALHGFRLLAPILHPRPGYVLFLDAAEHDAEAAEAAAGRLERALRGNPQYDYARNLGQLAPVAAARVPCALERYYEYLGDRGRRRGDIKAPGFHPHGDWPHVWHEYLPVPLRSRD
jgi:hypothetical protein